MTEISILQILNDNNLIVPEIQREYVWGFNQHDILITFIQDIKEAYSLHSTDDQDTLAQIETLERLLENTHSKAKAELRGQIQEQILDLKDKAKGQEMNIGFLYSYMPNYETDHLRDLYLIDGQQRFTTLILFLFYFSIKEQCKDRFLDVLRFDSRNDKIAFDYRVRTVTHNFILDLFDKTTSVEELLNLISQNWFLSNYRNDTTVKAIVGTVNSESGVFNILDREFRDDENKYFDFLLTKIKFWHFRTEKTAQGEELYITMNSRGQQLADYENIRAKLFSAPEVKLNQLEWSGKWEEWQDFFWKHQDRRSDDIDSIFNEFLRWVTIIAMIEKGGVLERDNQGTELRSLMRSQIEKLPISYLDLNQIQEFFCAVEYFKKVKEDVTELLRSEYPNYEQIQMFDIDWLRLSEGKGLRQIDLFVLLPVLKWLVNRFRNRQEVQVLQLFRIVKFLVNKSRDSSISKSPDQQTLNAVKMINGLGENEDLLSLLDIELEAKTMPNENDRTKLLFLRLSDQRNRLEEAFWSAEDYFESFDGDISHLLAVPAIAELSDQKLPVDLFNVVFNVYKEIWENEEKTWGDLIISEMYYVRHDRVWCADDWERNAGLMAMVNDRLEQRSVSLDDFLRNRRKNFVRGYASRIQVYTEPDPRKQLYLYYIITIEVIKKKWVWDDRWNFGVYAEVEGCNSLFETGYIYERFGGQWRYNSGYSNGFWLQEHADPKRDYLQEVLDWANT